MTVSAEKCPLVRLRRTASKAPAAEVAASSCLRRAAALAGLGLELWG
jgi:hypothetical protein